MKAAIEAGRHVFVEKPHAIDPAGVRIVEEACELARRKGLGVVSGLQSRYHPGYIETMEKVHAGLIGDIVAIQETWLRPPYVVRQRRPKQKELEFQASNQYHFHWLSGDDVPQTLIHNLDRSSWALGNAAPLRCWGMGGQGKNSAPFSTIMRWFMNFRKACAYTHIAELLTTATTRILP
jgi:predicted dehydrogenase